MPVRADEITEAGFTIVGTVAPGKTELTYRYRIPRDRSGTQRIVLDQPPRNAQVRVILEAGGAARLTVAGFGAAQTKDAKGVPVLVAQRTAEKGEPGIKTLDITLAGDPR
jgi:hypothetical protein